MTHVKGQREKIKPDSVDPEEQCNWCKSQLSEGGKITRYTLVDMKISRMFCDGKCTENGVKRMVVWALNYLKKNESGNKTDLSL